MDKIDWAKFGFALLKFLFQYFAPAVLVVGAYDQCVCKPAIQKAAAVAPK